MPNLNLDLKKMFSLPGEAGNAGRCPDCKGSGVIALLNKTVPCACVSQAAAGPTKPMTVNVVIDSPPDAHRRYIRFEAPIGLRGELLVTSSGDLGRDLDGVKAALLGLISELDRFGRGQRIIPP